MNQIYKNASYILAELGLHIKYLEKNTVNQEVFKLIYKYRETIYKEIFNINHSSIDSIHDIKSSMSDSTQHANNNHYSIIQKLISKNLIKENKKLKMEMKENEDMEKIYKLLVFLIDDWSNLTWVISEYRIAKEKYKQYGTPLKYTFVSLSQLGKPFFSYHFDDDNDQQQQQYLTNNSNSDKSNIILNYENVDDPKTFNPFLRTRFMQRSYLDMILNSKASRNEDRFNVILPLWDKYKHIIKNKNTISEWNITDMTSVRLKLYEIMDGLWDKARLLYACSIYNGDNILPSFANTHDIRFLKLFELDDFNYAYEDYRYPLLECIQNEIENNWVEQLVDEYKMKTKPIWTENLTSIQLDHHRHYLSVKSNSYFIRKMDEGVVISIIRIYESLVKYSYCHTHIVHIPFFTFTIPDYIDVPPLEYSSTCICLIGNIDENKWAMTDDFLNVYFNSKYFCSDDYTFNIY